MSLSLFFQHRPAAVAVLCLTVAATPAVKAADIAPPVVKAADAAPPAVPELPDPLTLFPAMPVPDDPRVEPLLTLGRAPDELAQANNGPGLIVCQPVAADPALRDFANGCGAWLHIAAAGGAGFDRTPQLSSLTRVQDELGTKDLELTEKLGRSLPGMFGVTHFAVGTLTAAGDQLTLSYQVFEGNNFDPVAKALTVTGTRDQIVAGLPALAARIASAIGPQNAPSVDDSKSRNAPLPAIGLAPDDIALAGRLMFHGDTAYATGEERDRLSLLETKDALAQVCYWRFGQPSQTRLNQSVVRAIQAGNPILIAEGAAVDRSCGAAHRKAVDTLFAARPTNYLLAATETLIERELTDRVAERKAAEAAVQASAANPEAWRALGWSIEYAQADIWHGRSRSDLTAEEIAASELAAKRRFACAQKAMDLDPKFGLGSLDLSMAAEEKGEHTLAGTSFWIAASLDPEKCNVYRWGIALFGKRHLANAGQLRTVAKVATRIDIGKAIGNSAASDPRTFVATLRGAKFRDEAAQLKAAFQKELTARLTSRPDDLSPRMDLASWSEQEGDWKQALTLYRDAEKIAPTNGDPHCSAGDMLDKLGKPEEAIAEYRKALAIDPDNQAALYGLGWDQKHLGHLDEAEKTLKQAVAANPYSAGNHYGLAMTYAAQTKSDAAIDELRQTLLLDPDFDAYADLCAVLMAAGKYDQIPQVARQALNADPMNSDVVDSLAEVYLLKKDPEQARKLAQYAITLDGDDARAHEALAESYLQSGKVAQAQEEWKAVVKLADDRTLKTAQDYLKKYPAGN